MLSSIRVETQIPHSYSIVCNSAGNHQGNDLRWCNLGYEYTCLIRRWGCTMTPERPWSEMIYRNSEMKVDQLVNYLNDEKINLSPVFQRGHVWTIGTRKQLIKNIVQGRPIPAIFL